MAKTNIQWSDDTNNPWTGCTKVSPGCTNCYAECLALRLHAMGNPRYQNRFEPTFHPEALDYSLKLKEHKRIFLNSMSDAFHKAFPIDYLYMVFAAIHRDPRHVYQLLTKRGERLVEIGPHLPWADNIWMGVSVENDLVYNARGDKPTDRIDQLRQCGARVRFLSCEPLLGPLPDLDLRGIHQVIIGEESGSKARPMDLAWVRDLIWQCRRADVPIFVKQLGQKWARGNGYRSKGRLHGQDPATWPADLRIREMPKIYAQIQERARRNGWL